MARGQIVVETSDLENTATTVESLADQYETGYGDLFKSVQALKGHWEGADNDAYTDQIEGFRDDFEKMTKLMRDYAAYLRKTASTYRQTQQDVASEARRLKN